MLRFLTFSFFSHQLAALAGNRGLGLQEYVHSYRSTHRQPVMLLLFSHLFDWLVYI
jgi:hypothetical protein